VVVRDLARAAHDAELALVLEAAAAAAADGAMTARVAPVDRFDRRLLAPMILGSILNPINSSIIAVALVPIAVAFGAPAAETAWLVSSLYVRPRSGNRSSVASSTSSDAAALPRGHDPHRDRRPDRCARATIVVLVIARIVLGFGTAPATPPPWS